LEGAIAFAHEVADKCAPKTRELTAKLRDVDPAVFSSARERARRISRGQLAPLAAIGAVEASTMLPFDEGCSRETELFDACLYSPQSKAMIHAFFAERAVWKIPKNTPVREIRRVAILGAGTMGGGIAMTFANAGIPVIVKEVSQEALERGIATVRQNYARSVRKGAVSQSSMDERMALIKPQISY
jgi:3-hydroxyacyl-CoA dehydrogenase